MKTKTEVELLDILVEADEDILCDRTASLEDTFDSLRKELEAGSNDISADQKRSI